MIYIHVGMPKTGSSAIQAFLKLNYKRLAEIGYLYPNPPDFEQSYQTSAGNAVQIFRMISQNKFEETIQYINGLDPLKNHIILSSESLFDSLRCVPDRFFQIFNEYEYRIICYVRRQDNSISSRYNQLVKNRGIIDIDKPYNIEEMQNFNKTLLRCLDYTDSTNIVVRPYEKQQFINNNIISDFLHYIGIEYNENFIMPEKIVNPSLDLYALEFRKILNKFSVDNIIKDKLFLNSLLAKISINNNKGKPFQENNIFSPRERIQILEKYKEKNKQIAKIFLNRDCLFYDNFPNKDESFEKIDDISFDRAKQICKQMLMQSNSYENSSLRDSMILGTAMYLLNGKNLNKTVSLENTDIVFKLEEISGKVSKDITKLEKKSDVWYIESIGKDPYFNIHYECPIECSKVIILIGIFTINDTVLQLFYYAKGQKSITKRIEKGYNEIIIELDTKNKIEGFRLDPGNTPGIYLLEKFEVRNLKGT